MTYNKVAIDDKVSLAYEFINLDKDDDEKPLLLFLHEGLGSIAQWKSFPKDLCKFLNLNGVVYERYGYGHSTAFQEQRKPDYLYREADYFLPLLLQKLQLENRDVILIGHSDGASIALLYASYIPNNVILVVSMAAHVFVDEQSNNGIKEAFDFYNQNPKLKEKLSRYHFDHVDSTFYAWAEMWQTEEFKRFNMEDKLREIKVPILAIQGVNDEYGLPSQVDSIVSNGPHPNNEKLMIPNCGHAPHFQAREITLNSIKQFVDKNS